MTAEAPPAARPLLPRFTSNVAAIASSAAVERGAQLVLVSVAARALGPEHFGRYSFAASAAAILAFTVDLGLTLWTTRALAREPGRAPEVLGTGLQLRLVATLPYLLAIGSVALVLDAREARIATLALGVAALARAYLDHARAVFRAHERLSHEAMVNGATAIAAAGAGLGALHATGGVSALAIGVMAGTSAGAVFGFLLLRRRYGPVAGTLASFANFANFDRALARRMLREAFPFWLAGLASLIYTRSDVILLKLLAGDAEVGVYRAAGHVFEVARQVPAFALMALFPELARRFRTSKVDLRRLERVIALGLTGAGLAAGLALAGVAPPLAGAVFGSAFARSIPSLQLLAIAMPFTYVNCGLLHFLAARDLGVFNLTLSGLMVPLNLGANLLLARRLGAPGAALATVATEAALTAGCLLALRAARRRE